MSLLFILRVVWLQKNRDGINIFYWNIDGTQCLALGMGEKREFKIQPGHDIRKDNFCKLIVKLSR